MASLPSFPSPAAESRPTDILFVDDDAILRTAFTKLLELQGYVVQSVADGAKALEFLERHRPRLVITDIFMPNTDGIELILGLKKAWPRHGVLAISGGSFGPPDLFLKTARLLGQARTLPKPFRPDELIEVVKEMLELPVDPDRALLDRAGA